MGVVDEQRRPLRGPWDRTSWVPRLKEIGVDSIKELRHRYAGELEEMIENRHGHVVGLSEKTVQGWIDAAQEHGT